MFQPWRKRRKQAGPAAGDHWAAVSRNISGKVSFIIRIYLVICININGAQWSIGRCPKWCRSLCAAGRLLSRTLDNLIHPAVFCLVL